MLTWADVTCRRSHKRSSGPSGDIVACYMGLTWARDDGYEVVDCSMLEWHNAAAEIAMELSPERPQVIWRDYQYQASCNRKKLYKYTLKETLSPTRDLKFQHLYNAIQGLLKKRGANCAYYYGIGYVAPQLRGRLTHDVLMAHEPASLLPNVDVRVTLNTMRARKN